MTYATCRLTAKNRDHLRNLTLGNRVWANVTITNCRRSVAWLTVTVCVCSVVKEEIVDDSAHLPCINGRVVCWVWYIDASWPVMYDFVGLSVSSSSGISHTRLWSTQHFEALSISRDWADGRPAPKSRNLQSPRSMLSIFCTVQHWCAQHTYSQLDKCRPCYVGLYKWQAISVHKVEVMQTKIRQYESYAVQCIQNYVLSAICQSGFTRATSFAF